MDYFHDAQSGTDYDYSEGSASGNQHDNNFSCNLSNNTDRICWICFSSTIEDKDEWLTPCKCKGSSKDVHQSCLLGWIKVQQKGMLSKSVSCPQCHTAYLISFGEVGFLSWLIPLSIMDAIKQYSITLLSYGMVGMVVVSGYLFTFCHGAMTFICYNGITETKRLILIDLPHNPLLLARLLIGLPLIPIGLLSASLGRVSWLFPLIPGLVFDGRHELIHQHLIGFPPSTRFMTCLLPFFVVMYNSIVSRIEKYILHDIDSREALSIVNLSSVSSPLSSSIEFQIDSEDDSETTSVDGESLASPTQRQSSSLSTIGSLRLSSIASALLLPCASAVLGSVGGWIISKLIMRNYGNILQHRQSMSHFYKAILASLILVSSRDLFRLLYLYQKIYQRKSMRILNYSHPENAKNQ